MFLQTLENSKALGPIISHKQSFTNIIISLDLMVKLLKKNITNSKINQYKVWWPDPPG